MEWDRSMSKPLAIAATLVATFLLAACSEAPTAVTPAAKSEAVEKKEPPGPPMPVTAKTAFFEMYKPVRAWAADFMLLSLASNEVPSLPSADGKFGMWTGIFVSPSRSEAHTFTYSVVDSGATIHKGVEDQGSQAWSGPTPASRPFQTMDFVVDSDAAYQTAFAKAKGWVEAHPGKKAAFTLANASRFPTPVWYILWGNKTSGYASFVSANTGAIVKAR